MKIKKGDTVMVIAGKEKGKTGTVTQSLPQRDMVVIEGLNEVKRHKKNTQMRSQGQIVTKSAPIHVSNVSVLEGKKPVRVGYKVDSDGDKTKKVRVARPSGKAL